MDLVLASASPRRLDLMREAGYRFTVVPAAVEESEDSEPGSLAALTEENAALKARWAAEKNHGKICIGADTLVMVGGRALGKPSDHDAAVEMLRSLVGKTHQVCTGVCLVRAGARPREKRFHAITRVTFKPLTEGEIHAYLKLINPLDKAGSYAAQEHGERIISEVDGSWTNVVGLPIEQLAVELDAFASRPCHG